MRQGLAGTPEVLQAAPECLQLLMQGFATLTTATSACKHMVYDSNNSCSDSLVNLKTHSSLEITISPGRLCIEGNC